MKNTLNLTHIAIAAIAFVFAFMFLRGCFPAAPQPAAALPTVNINIDSTFVKLFMAQNQQSKPVFTGSRMTPAAIHEKETIYKIDTAATKEMIAGQFDKLLDAFLKMNFYDDTLHFGELGYVAIRDTTQKNAISGRSFSPNLKQKEITKTVTITQPPKPRNQVYLYGGIEGNRIAPFKNGLGARAGILFRNKKESMFSADVSFWPGSAQEFGFTYYRPLRW